MRIDVITIFPSYLAPLRESLLGKAIDDDRVQLAVHDLRDWTTDRHRTVDDAPYGGGPGMVMKPDVWSSQGRSELPLGNSGPPHLLGNRRARPVGDGILASSEPSLAGHLLSSRPYCPR